VLVCACERAALTPILWVCVCDVWGLCCCTQPVCRFAFHTCGYAAGAFSLPHDKLDVFVPRKTEVHMDLVLKEASKVHGSP
jgi:hypothetical protein